MKADFQRVAIVNRGESAMRAIHAIREFNLERKAGLRAIALYTDTERNAMFVREADEAFSIGPATYFDEKEGQRKISYLDYQRLENVLVASKAEAVWVGWGFVAEHAAFADLCARLGVTFIGPSGDAMRRVGDKIGSKLMAESVNVPVAPWSGGPVETLEDARAHAERIGFPLMIKATAGGGGRGIRKVTAPGELDEAFERARSEALKAFGDPTVFMEKVVTDARHIEIQMIGDKHGTVWAVGVRDCSVQRRNQKVIEESASTELTPEQEQEAKDAAIRLCRAAGYYNAGTVEFLYDPKTRQFALMEVNARLQVEHPVTEMTTRLDMVKLQIHVAMGGKLEGQPPTPIGHAIEARLNAEDPDNNFAPAPGMIELLRMATGPGVRIDTGVEEGDTIPSEFDSMIAKVIAAGKDRQEAIARLSRALATSKAVVQGGTTNKAFLLKLLDHPDFRAGNFDTTWLDRLTAGGDQLSVRNGDVALVAAAIAAYEAQAAEEKTVFYQTATRGRPKTQREIGRKAEFQYRGNSYEITVFRSDRRNYRVEVEGCRIGVLVDNFGKFVHRFTFLGRPDDSGRDSRVCKVTASINGPNHLVEVDGEPHQISSGDAGAVRAPAPAVVVAVAVNEGDEVKEGDKLVILEAMKMELPVFAPFAGRVGKILVLNNEQVDSGAPLLQIEPLESGLEQQSGARVKFDALNLAPARSEEIDTRLAQNKAGLRSLMLGFDIDPAEARRLLAEYKELFFNSAADDPGFLRSENDLLTIFSDVTSLFRRQSSVGDTAETAFGGEESMLTYLRSIDARGKGLSPKFIERLKRALKHYGISDIEPTPELEEALVWLFKANQRFDQQAPVIQYLFERQLANYRNLAPKYGTEYRLLLDRIIVASHGRNLALSELAQEVRYRLFDEPFFNDSRSRAFAEAEAHLAAVAENPATPDRQNRVRALVESPQPLVNFLISKCRGASPSLQRFILEAVTLRYFRLRDPENIRTFDRDGWPIVTLEYIHPLEKKRVRVVTTYADFSDLDKACAGIAPVVADIPPDCDVVMDFYLSQTERMDVEATHEEIQSVLNRANFPRTPRGIAVAVGSSAGAIPAGEAVWRMEGMKHFTYRPSGEGFHEEKLYRGIHPIFGKRMQLWRLRNFDLERLQYAEGVYLFRGVARENPKDERLFVVAEVRDLTPIRDEEGRIRRRPYLEHVLIEALTSIRRENAKRPVRERYQWNRIFLYVLPPLDMTREEFNDITERLAPAAEGLGIERVVIRAKIPRGGANEFRDTVINISGTGGSGLVWSFHAPSEQPLSPMSEYERKVVQLKRRGLNYPYEVVKLLTPPKGSETRIPPGEFREYDLDETGERLLPVDRPYGLNKANLVVGVIRNYTSKYPEGMTRVIALGDPSRSMGSITEAECRRIIAGLHLARELRVPFDWLPISAGAKISMESGTENMDWIAHVIREIVLFTQEGREINIVVDGINVGAQPYWNSEATMLMHTKGILIMTPQGAMVLTGKRALEYSGSVAAEDNFGIGGYEKIMGPNGQAQYWARDIVEACEILLRHYDHAYVLPGERFPRRARTSDPTDRDVQAFPYSAEAGGFKVLGEVLSPEFNPGRKKPFDIRSVMQAVIDQDHSPLERWTAWRDGEIAVVWDAHIGGYPVCTIGIESRPIQRTGFVPGDGPEVFTSGTLFPQSSRKIARAINSASGNRPLVVLANLSGFDGSPESLRLWQLEYGAEIGRAVVNFKGPIVFCVVSRYHGGAFVVFSKTLNDNMEVAALDGTYASVIGGAPAAAVVFTSEVENRTKSDPRVEEAAAALAKAEGTEKTKRKKHYDEMYQVVYAEKLGQVAEEFDKVHNVQRAQSVGSLDHIIPPATMRQFIVDSLDRGVTRELERLAR